MNRRRCPGRRAGARARPRPLLTLHGIAWQWSRVEYIVIWQHETKRISPSNAFAQLFSVQHGLEQSIHRNTRCLKNINDIIVSDNHAVIFCCVYLAATDCKQNINRDLISLFSHTYIYICRDVNNNKIKPILICTSPVGPPQPPCQCLFTFHQWANTASYACV